MLLERLKRALPQSKLGWVLAVTTALGWLVILGMIGFVLAPTMGDTTTLGAHDWDQMESHRYLVRKTILAYHEFPFWNPYACGGHPNWGGFESGTIVVSPWLPFYLTMTLAHALRVEVWGFALISAVGAWLLASRFTRSPALRALAAVAFAVEGRWALQISSGHTWHLVYGLTPWVLYFYDRAVGADPTRGLPRRRYAVLTGVLLACMVYTGGIYPLPETVFAVAVYGLLLAVTTRSLRPIGAGLLAGVVAFGLAAPKLLPLFEVLSKHPRLIDSNETLDFSAFVDVLTSKDQDMSSDHGGVSQWSWHEWGMYVGWGVVVVVLVGVIAARGTRESPMKWAGLLLLALGFGAFDPHAPWPLLHHLPVFQSQHVPSRWMYPALLMLLVVTAAAFERMLARSGRLRGWIELVLMAGVAFAAYDIATISRQPTVHMFPRKMPEVAESTGPFHIEQHLPGPLVYEHEWSPASLTAEMANIGTIDCGTFPAFDNYWRNDKGHVYGLGAHGVGDAAYKGEAFIADGVGTATIAHWTPNSVTVEVHGSQAGERLVLNQNYDEGWTANGTRADNWEDTVSTPIHDTDARVVFRYRPPSFWPGVLVFLGTCASLFGWALRSRRVRRRATGT